MTSVNASKQQYIPTVDNISPSFLPQETLWIPLAEQKCLTFKLDATSGVDNAERMIMKVHVSAISILSNSMTELTESCDHFCVGSLSNFGNIWKAL